jgi:cyclase
LFAERAFAPVAIGGNIETLAEVGECFKRGGDKVVIGAAALENPGFITEIAMKYGSQAVVVACDVLEGEAVSGKTGQKAGFSPVRWAQEAECRGAGEIYLQSVALDGSLAGFPLSELREVAQAVGIPVVVGTGCGGWRDMRLAFEAGASGAVTSVVHHWSETAMMGFKRHLVEGGAQVRL